jgi:hypothetical protein
MTDPDILQTILKDSSFDLSLFSAEEINADFHQGCQRQGHGHLNGVKMVETGGEWW